MSNCCECPLKKTWIRCSYEEDNIYPNQEVRHFMSKEKVKIIELMSKENLKCTRWNVEKRVKVEYRIKKLGNYIFTGWIPVHELEYVEKTD